eukprot:57672-Rhodomonas_salina.1
MSPSVREAASGPRHLARASRVGSLEQLQIAAHGSKPETGSSTATKRSSRPAPAGPACHCTAALRRGGFDRTSHRPSCPRPFHPSPQNNGKACSKTVAQNSSDAGEPWHPSAASQAAASRFQMT